jgi:hypothetical protein
MIVLHTHVLRVVKQKRRKGIKELWFAKVYAYVIKHLSQTAAKVVMLLDRNGVRYVRYF